MIDVTISAARPAVANRAAAPASYWLVRGAEALAELRPGLAFYAGFFPRYNRMMAEHGFAFMAVEGDWPDCYRVNRYVKGYDDAGTNARDVLHAFERWPTWMWANREIVELADGNDGLGGGGGNTPDIAPSVAALVRVIFAVVAAS